MYFGKQLNSSYPDQLEIDDIESEELKEVFNKIFPLKKGHMNKKYVDAPSLSANLLLNLRFFNKGLLENNYTLI